MGEQMEGQHSLPWKGAEVKKAMVADLSFKDSVGICWRREAEAERTDTKTKNKNIVFGVGYKELPAVWCH